MPKFDLDNYIDVAERIEQFYAEYPNGRLLTELLNVEGWNGKQTQFIVKSYAYDGDTLLSTGLAEESFSSNGPNLTSALENAETSSLGRSLANLGYQTTREGKRQRPSRQEMEKVQRGPVRTVQDELKRLLSEKYPTPDERKTFLEERLGRTLTSLGDIDEAETAGLIMELS